MPWIEFDFAFRACMCDQTFSAQTIDHVVCNFHVHSVLQYFANEWSLTVAKLDVVKRYSVYAKLFYFSMSLSVLPQTAVLKIASSQRKLQAQQG